MKTIDQSLGYGLGGMNAHDAMIDEARRLGVGFAFVQRAWWLNVSVEAVIAPVVAGLLNRVTANWGV
jgi:hypothetical protein